METNHMTMTRKPGAQRLALWRQAVLPAAALLALGLLGSPAAQAANGLRDLPKVMPVMNCADLVGMDLSKFTDAKATITAATLDTTTAPAPFCAVTGTIAPANTFVVRLPTQGWTQRYVQTGCGGECGTSRINYTQASTCPVIVDGTVASATTDMGHQGMNDGSWAAANPQAQIDFAYRGVHVTAQVVKGLLGKFYGRKPAFSYFNGCSDGGREALMAAQRYPGDFDGIAAGAPAASMVVQNTYHHAWNVLTNRDADGNYILLASKLPMLHQAVLDACDGLDGLVDGLIDDPRQCRFNPATIQCLPGQDTSTCLTTAEVGVVRRLHDGATDGEGHHLEPKISHEWGSELLWTLFIPSAQGATVASENFVNAFARYLAWRNVSNPNWKLSDLPFTVAGFWDTVQTSDYLAALDPNLRGFANKGGKLLLWHGWNDHHISPQGTLAYYDALRKTMGSRTDEFAKLFLFPGVGHCGGGEGPDTFDVLTPVMAWVETGVVPQQIVASKYSGSTVVRSRPVYPFPQVARYLGTGSIDEAANFTAYTPTTAEPPAGADYRWLGKQLYGSGYQTSACHADGTQLVCEPRGPLPR